MRALVIIIIILVLAGGGYWIWKANDDKNEEQEIVTSLAAFNQTKNADATTVNAATRDVIVYTLTVENKSDTVKEGYVVEANITDITEAATLIDAQGANYNSTNNSLVWTPLDVPAKGSFDKKFTVRIKDSLPAGADYVMSAKFNNELNINIDRGVAAAPTPTPTPQPSPNPTPAPAPTPSPYKAPSTGPSPMVIVVIALAFTAGVLLFRKARKLA
jgi:hypothetical protein